MKNKNMFFIIFAVIEIVISIYIIITANQIIQQSIENLRQVEQISSFEYISENINKLETGGVKILIIEQVISILINLAVINTARKNGILKNKGLMITAMIVVLLLSSSIIGIVFSIVGLFLLITTKRKNPEDYPEKRELPRFEQRKLRVFEIIMGILLVAIYFSQFILENYMPDDIVYRRIIALVFYSSTFIIAILYWNKRLLEYFKSFGKNFGTYIRYIISKIGIMALIYLFVSIVTIAITKQLSSENEKSLESMNKIIVSILALIYAPIVEETIFRGLIRNIVKNKIVYIIVSAICFGLLHTVGQEASILNTIVNALPYATIGGFLAYLYAETDNMSSNMFVHFIINLFATLIMCI